MVYDFIHYTANPQQPVCFCSSCTGFATLVLVFMSFNVVKEQQQKLMKSLPVEGIVNASNQKLLYDAMVKPPVDLISPNTPDRDPITHVGFLKVHKAASTTTQAIFLRFGWRRNLTFVLPPEYNKFGYPNILSLNESVTKYNTLLPTNGTKYDILCHHVIYGRDNWRLALPNDTKMIGTVREPFSLFRSMLNYFHPYTIGRLAARSDDPVRTFLEDPAKYDNTNPQYSLVNNRLSIEYGVPPNVIKRRDFRLFNEYLYNVLDKDFTVVILANRFDEGLVMMKRKLNWTLNDIMYAMKNVRSEKKEDWMVVSEDLRLAHEKFCVFDYVLYDFFVKKFERQVQDEGPSFPREVDYFKETRTKVEEFCHGKDKTKSGIVIPGSEFGGGFTVDQSDCEVMHRGEIGFTQLIRKRQFGSADWTSERQAERRRLGLI